MSASPKTTAADRDEEYANDVATLLIDQLRRGVAPWQKPWKDSRFGFARNATTDQPYRGVNAMYLMAVGIERGYSDGRWLTFNQAQQIGATVRKGEHGASIIVVKKGYEILERDSSGKPVLDANGHPDKRYVLYDRPRQKFYRVFAAEQCEGVPPVESREPVHQWQQLERAERIISASGARISHGGNRAYYMPGLDYIQLPNREQFDGAAKYYAVALHELGHWSGHEDRLKRDLTGPFGSESYAKEELRAEISSLMVGQALEIGHDPTQHASYVDNWIKILQDDPKEIVRACADASKIHSYVMQYDREAVRTDELQHVEERTIEAQPLETEAAYAIKRDTQFLEQQHAIIKENNYGREEHGYELGR